MSTIGRRDSLKLASAAAALGAGLGVVLRATESGAQTGGVVQDKLKVARPGVVQSKYTPVTKLKIEATQQIKIDAYQKLPPEKGQLQIKLGTTDGQLLYAAAVPEEIAQLLLQAPGGQIQIKFWRPVAQEGEKLANEPFREGVMQFVPTAPR